MTTTKTQAFFTLDGKRAEMVWTEWEGQRDIEKEARRYYRLLAAGKGLRLEWIKRGKRCIFRNNKKNNTRRKAL